MWDLLYNKIQPKGKEVTKEKKKKITLTNVQQYFDHYAHE
jgi:hypothetical protein